MTTVMCCHEDMCNHEGTDGKRATKSLQQLQQRIKLNQQRDVAAAAALTGKDLKNSSGNAAAVAAASTNGECVRSTIHSGHLNNDQSQRLIDMLMSIIY